MKKFVALLRKIRKNSYKWEEKMTPTFFDFCTVYIYKIFFPHLLTCLNEDASDMLNVKNI